MGRVLLLRAALAALLLLPAAHSGAVEAPYEGRLMRLAEILGSLHYLRNLCGEHGTRWRDEMDALLKSEKPAPDRRARLVASFNRGYRSFSDIYSTCTPSATEAIARYMKEGETLTRETVSRFGN